MRSHDGIQDTSTRCFIGIVLMALALLDASSPSTLSVCETRCVARKDIAHIVCRVAITPSRASFLSTRASEIKIRAERRCGEMLKESAEQGTRATKGIYQGNQHSGLSRNTTTLPALNISRDQSSRWQQLASMSDAQFETAVSTAKEVADDITTAFVLRQAHRIANAAEVRQHHELALAERGAGGRRGAIVLNCHGSKYHQAQRTICGQR